MSAMNRDLPALKAEYDDLCEQEEKHRMNINAMRRELTILTKKRRAAKQAWLDANNGFQRDGPL